jgi:CheY-like chemotaxis protein
MALIAVISSSEETARELESALRGRGHTVRRFVAGQATGAGGSERPAMFVVNLDGGTDEAVRQVRRLGEDPATALTPVLVAGGALAHSALAKACAFGAVGYLRKPFISVETVPDTESVLFLSHAHGQPR